MKNFRKRHSELMRSFSVFYYFILITDSDLLRPLCMFVIVVFATVGYE